jgi:hypothetical protein
MLKHGLLRRETRFPYIVLCSKGTEKQISNSKWVTVYLLTGMPGFGGGQIFILDISIFSWIPAFAGMTVEKITI